MERGGSDKPGRAGSPGGDLSLIGATAPASSSPAGWTMDLVETLMADYHMTAREALRFPLAAARALWPARAARLGKTGPTAADRGEGRARERARAWLEAHFRILPDVEFQALAMQSGPAGFADGARGG